MLSVPLPEGLKSRFSASALKKPDAISRILLIGALVENDNGNTRLSPKDAMYLDQTVDLLEEDGIRFSKGPHLLVQNRAYESDFLKAPQRGQLAIFCHIFFDCEETHPDHYVELNQSPLAHIAGSWHKSLMASGARYAVNVHRNSTELPTASLQRDPFKLVSSRTSSQYQFDFLAR